MFAYMYECMCKRYTCMCKRYTSNQSATAINVHIYNKQGSAEKRHSKKSWITQIKTLVTWDATWLQHHTSIHPCMHHTWYIIHHTSIHPCMNTCMYPYINANKQTLKRLATIFSFSSYAVTLRIRLRETFFLINDLGFVPTACAHGERVQWD